MVNPAFQSLDADAPSASPITQWRGAFAAFERLQELDPTARAQALLDLARDAPDLHPLVLNLVKAHEEAHAGKFLTRGASLFTQPAEGPDDTLAAGTELGSYRLERPIGAGGMGEVWLARRADGLFEAPVALKLLHPHLATSSIRQRFVREGRILGDLSHPNVARLLDAGALPGGRLFIAIEYVEGQRIDQWCDARNLDTAARLRLFLQVCEAVSHAHARLVVHRDLKPSNILVAADGSVKLLDFGIAKLIETGLESAAETELTRLGGRALTPEYAAPEQVLGAPVTVATDVYSLGVLLYVLLTRRRPYGLVATTPGKLEREILETEPHPPSRAVPDPSLRRRLAGDLDTIVLKALKKAPAERYFSVAALAEDIGRHLRDQPVLARPDALSYRARKYLRRNRMPLAAACALLVTLIAGVAGVMQQSREVRRAEQRTREQAERLRRSKDFFVGIFANASPLHRKAKAPLSLAEAVDQAIARIDTELADDPRFQGDLLSDFGEIRTGQGDYPGAKAMFDRALALQEKTVAPDDPSLAGILINRGMIDSYYADANDGLPYLRRAAAILAPHADTEADALARVRMELSTALAQVGQAPAALKIALASLESLRRAPGKKEDNLAQALSGVGYAYYQLGRMRESAPYMREAVAEWERVFGPDSPNLLAPLEVLSDAAGLEGDVQTQIAYAERQVAVARKSYPEGGPYVVAALNNLAQVHRNLHRNGEAEALFRESAAVYERTGEDGYYAVHAYGGLGRLALERSTPAEALQLLERSKSTCTALPAQLQADGCLGYEFDRAQALQALQRTGEATALMEDTIAKLRALGPDELNLLRLALRAQAERLSTLGQHETAVVAAREHLALWLKAEPSVQSLAQAHTLLALCLARGGGSAQRAEARRLFSQVAEPAGAFVEWLPEHRLAQAELDGIDGARESALKNLHDAIRLLESRRPFLERSYQRSLALLRSLESPPATDRSAATPDRALQTAP